MRLLPQVGHAVVGWRIDDGGLEFDGARLYTVAVDLQMRLVAFQPQHVLDVVENIVGLRFHVVLYKDVIGDSQRSYLPCHSLRGTTEAHQLVVVGLGTHETDYPQLAELLVHRCVAGKKLTVLVLQAVELRGVDLVVDGEIVEHVDDVQTAAVVFAKFIPPNHPTEQTRKSNIIVRPDIIGVDNGHPVDDADNLLDVCRVDHAVGIVEVGARQLYRILLLAVLLIIVVGRIGVVEHKVMERPGHIDLKAVVAFLEITVDVEGAVGLTLIGSHDDVATLKVLADGSVETDTVAVLRYSRRRIVGHRRLPR